ncbi:tetraacyldisaccharide 4'-kinase [Wenzhouxiangella sp. AB-CW3]|uniref:tetraacyldisaccharide 4'-kinase n=1 Tax=Wenzhouxiangella sp. AB-CW3 TaxID=2771012 RepID=UPI00168B09EC|nr:tetraacyldisaccharide 4'-kinase [Wenzhouxiangella sp. AB-CW3]QOC21108.1 tetraacyldisaccharide 4'-kinase [Wenzhouxiangella sp. AB-CW3]
MTRFHDRFERYFNRLWYEQARPGFGWRALSGLYGMAARRHLARDYGKPPGPVIVVGNITVGGGGKTPVVAALSSELLSAGWRVAIISRGYGGRTSDEPFQVLPADDPKQCGDEPLLLARTTGCPVWVCRKRGLAMHAAFDDGADVVLSDDGLQHAGLPRSFEICVIDEARGFGNGQLLPAGPLRQPVARLDLVDLVLRKQAGGSASVSGLPGQAFAIEPGQAYRLADRQPVDLPSDQALDAVCGIANPESFFATLEHLGLYFRCHPFPDHHVFDSQALASLEGPLIVTEKDAVKLESLEGLPETLVLPVRASLPRSATQPVLEHVRNFNST